MWLCFSAPKTADACEEPSPQPYAVPSFNLRSQNGHSVASSQHGTLRSTTGPAQQQPTQRASTSAPDSHERTSSHHDTAASGQSPGGSPLEGHGQASPSTHDSGAKTIGNDAFGVDLCRVSTFGEASTWTVLLVPAILSSAVCALDLSITGAH